LQAVADSLRGELAPFNTAISRDQE